MNGAGPIGWVVCGALLAGAVQAGDDSGPISRRVYADLRSYVYESPEPLDGGGARVGVRARVGLRLKRMLGQSWMVDADARATAEYRDGAGAAGRSDAFVEVKRLFVHGEGIFGQPSLTFDAGRKRLRDERSWLLDDDLELLQIGYDSTLLDWQVGGAGWLWDGRLGGDRGGRAEDEPLEAVGSYYGYAKVQYQWRYRHFLGLNLLREDYRRPDGATAGRVSDAADLILDTGLRWITAHAGGQREFVNRSLELEYALDVGMVSGDWDFLQLGADRRPGATIRRHADQALGYDLRLVSRFRNNRYALGLGYAGGDPDYVQPQAAGNREQILGVRRYRSYGEVLSPRLTNIRVYSLWVGAALNNRMWLEGVFHDYRQAEAATVLLSDRSLFVPNGRSSDLGQGLDVVLGGRLNRDTDVLVSAGALFGGEAFDGVTRDPDGYRVTVEINVRW